MTMTPAKALKVLEESTTDIILHPRLSAIFDEVQTCLMCAKYTDQKLLVMCGPTGVGKSTVGKMVEKWIIDQEMAKLKTDPGYTPVMRVAAAKAEEKKSVWKEWYLTALSGYDDILIYRKSLALKEGSARMGQVSTEDSTTALRQALRNQIRERRTRLVIIDECQHLLAEGQGRTVKENMDVLKSLCTETGVTFLLIGPYDLPMLLELEGQLIRRSKLIHFKAYGHSEEDNTSFLDAAKKIAKALPLPLEEISTDFLIQSSLRYTGLLRDLLYSGTIRALQKKKRTVGLAELKESAKSPRELQALLKEQQVGEAFMAGDLIGTKDLREALGLSPEPKPKKEKARKRGALTGSRHSKHDSLQPQLA